MKKTNKTLVFLSIMIAFLSLIASATGILWRNRGASFIFETVRGEKVEIQGGGLYHYDTVSIVAQAIAQDMVNIFIAVPFLIVSLFIAVRRGLSGKLLLTEKKVSFLFF